MLLRSMEHRKIEKLRKPIPSYNIDIIKEKNKPQRNWPRRRDSCKKINIILKPL